MRESVKTVQAGNQSVSVFLSVKEFIRYNLKNTALRLCADGIMENNVKKRERERERSGIFQSRQS